MRQMGILILGSLMAIFTSCGKASTTPAQPVAPTNLVVAAVVQPDNSGNVNFTATATNATSYEFDFGNGVFQIVPSGSVTYKYPAGGTYTVNVQAKNATAQSVSKSLVINVTIIPSGQSLIWSDEFNTNGAPDATKWGYDIGNGSGGWGNQELEYYTNRPENVIMENGVLKIKAIKENFSGYGYTSARLLSKGKFDFKYGKVEVSAKMPTGVGTWPAIWMLGSNFETNPWPACGEIDIMEHLGRDLNNIYATLHYPGRSGGNADGGTKKISNAATAFHKYSLEWSASSVKMYVDDQLVHSVNNPPQAAFDHNFFFILNLAMGGNFAGPVDPAVTGATLEIDYIRVYSN